jgi:hypothetical protein
MRRVVLMVFAFVLVFSIRAAAQDTTLTLAPSTPAGAAATPPAYNSNSEFPLRLDIGYQFTQFRGIDTMTFHNNGINTSFTGYTGHDFALEFNVDVGFGTAPYTPTPASATLHLSESDIFYGGGMRIGPEGRRFEPWAHLLVGGEHMRFTQYSEGPEGIGIDNGLGWKVGVGADIKIGPRAFWRVQGDYLGTHMFAGNEANYSVGTSIGFAF